MSSASDNVTPTGRPMIPRAFFRATVNLRALVEVEGMRKPLHVIVQNLGGKGAALITDFQQELPNNGMWIELTLPTRPEPMELQILTVNRRPNPDNAEETILHVTFPTIALSQQDAIVAYLNQLRSFERKQRIVEAPADVEVVTGRRAFATFKGHTLVVRPDHITLHMDRFDHIDGSDVTVTVMTADRAAKINVDGSVESTRAIADGAFEAEIAIASGGRGGSAKPGDKLIAFLRQHYPQPEDSR